MKNEEHSGEYYEEHDSDSSNREASQAVAGWQGFPFKFVARGDEQRPHCGGDFVLRRASQWLDKITTYSLDHPPPLPSLTEYILAIMEDILHLR